MAEKEGHIPSWDGQPRTWRRYTREVSWFFKGTPVHKRRYCATRPMGRLTGSARLLAMSWTGLHLDHYGGTRELLQRLAASPLVRQGLPNAAAICTQYFAFRRQPYEAMNGFLVREALVHSEFIEALQTLYEEKQGVKPSDQHFDLPDEEDEWWDDAEGDETAAHDGGQQSSSPAASPAAFTGMSPSSRAMASSPTGQPSVHPGFHVGDGFSVEDSFILQVLRGFRLLQASGLTPDEMRDIVAATKGSLDFNSSQRIANTI